MEPIVLLNKKQLELTTDRLAFELIESHLDFNNTAIIGLQRTGALFSQYIVERIRTLHEGCNVEHGLLDVTFYRDDFGRRDTPLEASSTELDFPIENKNIILIDDVLYTGRTIRAAMDALVSLGRPSKVELMVLIDRRFSRQLPIEPTYVGKMVDSIASQHVKVNWTEKGFQKATLFEKEK
jgi:pyrimidine operon attenuation protein/uracil phosphoribosyltransferase